MKSPKRSKLRYPFLIYLVVALTVFWHLVINFTTAVPGITGESYLGLFYLWNAPYSIFNLHTTPYFTQSILYPVGDVLPFAQVTPLAGVITYPIQWLSRAAAYNLVVFAGFILSAMFMYLLAERLTGNRHAALLAGLVFAFNPLHVYQAYFGLGAVSTEFVPLLLYFAVLFYQERKPAYVAYAAVAAVFLVFFGNTAPSFLLDTILALVAALILALLLKFIIAKKWIRSAYAFLIIVFAVVLYYGLFVSLNVGLSPTSVPQSYAELQAPSANFSMLFLPALPNYTSPDPYYYQQLSMYYQTVANKPMVDGYAQEYNQTQSTLLTSIPLSVESNYLLLGEGFTYTSPITENYTNVTLLWLAADRVAFVSVIRPAYNASEQGQLLSYLYSIFGEPVYQDQNSSVFETNVALSRHVGKSLTAFTTGTWVPGYALCGSSQCNTTFAATWFGGNIRGIALFVPSNVTKVQMGFTAESGTGRAVGVLQGNQLVDAVTPGRIASRYAVNMSVAQGYNYILFAEQGTINATSESNVSTDYGITNVTFKAVP